MITKFSTVKGGGNESFSVEVGEAEGHGMVSMVALPEAEGSIRRYTNMSEVMIPRLSSLSHWFWRHLER